MKSYIRALICRVCEEPYRIFFPLGISFGIIGVGHWFSFTHGWGRSYSGWYHSSIQMQAYMASIVSGFLMTMIPRQSLTPHATCREVLSFLLLAIGVLVFNSLGIWAGGEICFALWLAGFLFFVIRRFRIRKAKAKPPVEFIWIPMAMAHGIIGSILLALTQLHILSPWFLKVGKPMVDQGFILSIVLGVGSFLSSRLMGLQKLIKVVDSDSEKKALESRQVRSFVNLISGLILFLTFWTEGFGFVRAGYLARAFVVTSILFLNRAWPRPPRTKEFFVKLIWISMWMVVCGYWATVIFWSYRIDMLHIVFIGGYSLMTFAVGTMVVLSHAGEAAKLHKRLIVLWIVVLGILGAVGHRVSSAFFPETYVSLIGSAAGFWLLAGICWLSFILPKVLRVSGSEESESCKSDTRKRISD